MRMFEPDDGNPASGTTGYVACVFLDEEGKPTPKFLVGKPHKKGEGDYTKRGGGPYVVDISAKTCECPDFTGTKAEVKPDGRIIPPRSGNEECKHHIGLLEQLRTHKYELLPIKGVSDRMLVRWILAETERD
jgi:hypothetical protein